MNDQPSATGVFTDIALSGNQEFQMLFSYNSNNDSYAFTNPVNTNFPEDRACIVYRKIKTDFQLNAKIEFPEINENPLMWAGIIISQFPHFASAQVSAVISNKGELVLHNHLFEDKKNEKVLINPSVSFLQMLRKGNILQLNAAKNGQPLKAVQTFEINFPNEIYIGLLVQSINTTSSQRVVFSNVRIEIPAPLNFQPYRDYIGSRIEILDIQTGIRKLVYETDKNLEAPNWSSDGKFLILNGKGLIYKFNLNTGKLEVVPTGFANKNNNDHGISPNGKQLVISNHIENVPHEISSHIFTLPIEGGLPQKITSNGPSYWHGWSPDGKFLIYTANRNNQWNIFRIPSAGGDEIQLTNSPGLNDGSEYSANGQTIWFNSNRTGSMEIWKMNADGSLPVQITNDEYQNWFAHESPDGKWIVFLSYLPEVNKNDHPYYKNVLLRMMPATGGDIKVVAYLYGGQGSLNVASWSPNSRNFAFVSNSDKIE